MNDQLLKEIKNELEKYYHVGFDVERVFDQDEKYKITPKGTYSNTFVIMAAIRDNIRLIVTCEPDKYGKLFLENINKSNEGLRNNFVNYWKQLGENQLKVVINDKECNIQDFLNNDEEWNKFYIRYSKAPFFDEIINDRNKNVIDVISWICGMILAITDYSIVGLEDGAVHTSVSKKYERNPVNRKLCLAIKGYNCSVCGMNFEETYGEIGKNFIHVHHIVPLHLIGESYVIDPIKDLFPVCPNCHNMLHRVDPPYSIEELKEIINNQKMSKGE